MLAAGAVRLVSMMLRCVTAPAAPVVTVTTTVTGGTTAISAVSASMTKKPPSWPTRLPSVTGAA